VPALVVVAEKGTAVTVLQSLLLRAFGRPTGILGKIGGLIMARSNRNCAAWVIGLLDVAPRDKVLEVGFGPGVGIELLTQAASGGYVFGIDPSREMLDQTRARNADAILSGHVDLQLGTAEALPFRAGSFDKAVAINTLQIWPDAVTGLREVHRVMKTGGRIAIGFTRHSGQKRNGLIEKFAAAGFANVRIAEKNSDFCVLAEKRLPLTQELRMRS
jgi:ubiquinone/menaquinone biosynthesis C-methylase UbiE